MQEELRKDMNAVARQFVWGQVGYLFTWREQQVLRPFFSNSIRRIFFMSGLPESVAVTLLAMYSRLKNPRGLRGHFVDHLVPLLMCSQEESDNPVVATPWKELQKRFKAVGLDSLDKICDSAPEFQAAFLRFLAASANPDYWQKVADSGRIRDFKEEHIEKYGDKSITRPARLLLCAEDVSILVAKILESTDIDFGRIELSTRYVSFVGKCQYPVEEELSLIDGALGRIAAENIENTVGQYRRLLGAKFDGPFPEFLRKQYGAVVPAADLEAGVTGESCDVLGNLLPCSTLTQVGLAISGEAFGEQLLKNLYLEGTPECVAVADLIVEEASRIGHNYFVRRYTPTEWEKAGWTYLPPDAWGWFDATSHAEVATRMRFASGQSGFNFGAYLNELEAIPRGSHDILPERFRNASVMMKSTMSFRGWRDSQRQSRSVHRRGRVTPLLGFYEYPKAAPGELAEVFRGIHLMNKQLYAALRTFGVPPGLAEYPMAMGNLVPYQMTFDLRQAEFCSWQRTKWLVNDEVRQEFITIEKNLRNAYDWWKRFSRADVTPHYVFARGSKPVTLPSV